MGGRFQRRAGWLRRRSSLLGGSMWRRTVCETGRLHACLCARGNSVVAQDSKPHKSFGTSTVFWTTKDEHPSPVKNTDDKKTDDKSKREATQATAKKNLVNLLGEMKVEISSKKTFQRLKAQKTKDQTEDVPEPMESASSMFQKATEGKVNSKPLSPELVAAASAVASSLPLDKKRTVSELLQLLKKHKTITDARKRGETADISNIVTNMKIGRKPPVRDASRPSNQIQFDEDGRGYTIERDIPPGLGIKKRGLFSAKRLNIFAVPPPATEGALETVTKPTIWDVELAKEITAVGQRPPRNGFEEMIEWTKEGKLWEFPINNEAGFEDDAEFYDHIFLEKHLADFPKEGPIRHFMELVCCGLSKNPYLSVKEKVEYIDWFRSYFKEKEELLKEIEALEKEVLLEREQLTK